jgi:DNA modification methylase
MKNQYIVNTVQEAKSISFIYLSEIELENVIDFGLPEIDDRYHIWRVPLKSNNKAIGEIVIDAKTSLVEAHKSTSKETLEVRLLGRKEVKAEKSIKYSIPKLSTLRNTIGVGDSEELLNDMPSESVDLVFTSPPYFNARPEYADYIEYEEYLLKMKKIIHQCHRVLNEGRFFVINISPVLIRRASRSESSRRVAVPFDFHKLFMDEGFEFMDDIIWQKPEGAGWATGRGRRFSADRNPLQYKPVPVTEYVLVYRKKTDKLIDWHIRKHPNQDIVKRSKISDGYEVTNIWKIHPSHSKKHPAIFPEELATKVIKYYSFIDDIILDPFGGIGTTARAAYKNERRFITFDLGSEYIEVVKHDLKNWFKDDLSTINWINVSPPKQSSIF